ARRVDHTKRNETAYEVGMHVRRACERVEVEKFSAHEGGGHRRLRGSKVDVAASSSNKRRSSAVSERGTMIRTSASTSPALPRGFGRPRPRKRNFWPLDVPA